MFGKLTASKLLDASWQLMKKEKKIFLAQLLLIIMSFLIFIVGAYFAFRTGSFTDIYVSDDTISGGFDPTILSAVIVIGTFFILGYLGEMVSAFVIAIALARFRGNPISAQEALGIIRKRGLSILLFTLLSSGVGYLLQIVHDYVPFFGAKVITWIGSVVWSVASVFSTVVIVDQNENNPFKAVNKSSKLIRKTLGDNIKVQLGVASIVLLGVMTAVLTGLIASTLMVVIGASSLLFGIVTVAVPLSMLIFVAILGNAYSAIVKAALYEYAISGKAPATFNKEMLEAAITRKKARKAFSW